MSEPIDKARIENTKIKIAVDFTLIDCYRIVVEDLMRQACVTKDPEYADVTKRLIKIAGLG